VLGFQGLRKGVAIKNKQERAGDRINGAGTPHEINVAEKMP